MVFDTIRAAHKEHAPPEEDALSMICADMDEMRRKAEEEHAQHFAALTQQHSNRKDALQGGPCRPFPGLPPHHHHHPHAPHFAHPSSPPTPHRAPMPPL